MKRKNQSGVVVVEAAIVVTVVTMLIAVMLYIGMVLYQQSIVNIMANQTATNIAQIYGNTLRDPLTGYVDANGVHEEVTYNNLRDTAYMKVIEQKAEAAVLYRLKSSRILTTGETEVDIEIVPKKNELLKDQIIVTVRDHYQIPLISFFGANNNSLVFTATGRADCTDLLEYLTGVPALGTADGNAIVFEENECTVNFYKHRGDTRPLKTIELAKGHSIHSYSEHSLVTMPANPSQDKMRFVKWVTESGNLFTGDTTVNGNINVYGVWACTVTFDPDGGTVNPTTLDGIVDGNITLPTATRNNCTFAGWFTEKNGKGEQFYGNNLAGDITVYAKWNCTVFLNADRGSVSPTEQTVVYGQTLTDAGYSLPKATRSNCTFAGWYTKLYGDGDNFTAKTKVNGTITVYAKWTATIKYKNSSNEEIVTANKSAIVGKPVKLASPPSRKSSGSKGWQFDGWKTKDGVLYTSDKTVITGNVDLFEHWHCNHVYKYNRTVTNPTCTTEGKAIYKCEYCGHEKEDILKKLGGNHEMGNPVIISPGCETERVVNYYCKKCGTLMKTEKSPALGHNKDGHCGYKHYFEPYFLPLIEGQHGYEGHEVSWQSCIVCTRCGKVMNSVVLCGTHYEKWGEAVGWPGFTFKQAWGHSNTTSQLDW